MSRRFSNAFQMMLSNPDRSGVCRRSVRFAITMSAALIAVTAMSRSDFIANAQALGDEDPMLTFRAPLLREGSTLVEAHAVLRREGEPLWWTLHIEPRVAAASEIDAATNMVAATSTRPTPANELIVLPCTRLSEMERILETTGSNGSGEVQFKVSGRVYVFRDRNYFLPTHAAVVSAERPSLASQPAPTSTPAEETATQAAPPATEPVDPDSAEAIARALEQQTGPIARSSAGARTPSTQSNANSSRPEITISASGSDRPAMMQENTAVVNRRGKITRDRSGGWLLVFDADATGLADPPLKLMPCSLMENIEDYARRTGNNSPIIVTGQVYLYNNQNHLLPTVYRIPRETSRLTP